jgi:hypothetical protein
MLIVARFAVAFGILLLQAAAAIAADPAVVKQQHEEWKKQHMAWTKEHEAWTRDHQLADETLHKLEKLIDEYDMAAVKYDAALAENAKAIREHEALLNASKSDPATEKRHEHALQEQRKFQAQHAAFGKFHQQMMSIVNQIERLMASSALAK